MFVACRGLGGQPPHGAVRVSVEWSREVIQQGAVSSAARGDVVVQRARFVLELGDLAFTMSPMPTIPTRASSTLTGRCRMRWSVISRMRSSAESSGAEVRTSAVIVVRPPVLTGPARHARPVVGRRRARHDALDPSSVIGDDQRAHAARRSWSAASATVAVARIVATVDPFDARIPDTLMADLPGRNLPTSMTDRTTCVTGHSDVPPVRTGVNRHPLTRQGAD